MAGMGVDYPANLYGSTTYTAYSQMRFAPAFSYKINDIVSVGVAVNIMYATMEFNVANAVLQTSCHIWAHRLLVTGQLSECWSNQ